MRPVPEESKQQTYNNLPLPSLNVPFSEYIPAGCKPCEMPKLNDAQLKTIEKHGPFIFDTLNKNREKRQPLKLPNGDIYDGEWIVGTDIKEGLGTIIYTNGNYYRGYFLNN